MPARKTKSTPKAAPAAKRSASVTPVTPVAAQHASPASPAPAPVAVAAKRAPEAKPAPAPASVDKPRKPKLVRDSFTVPKDEYAVIDGLKLRAAQQGHLVKKSELLRAGLKLLSGLDDKQLLAALQAVPSIKTGRPAKEDTTPAKPATPAPRAAKSAKAGKATKATKTS